jgi:hypothetical protein
MKATIVDVTSDQISDYPYINDAFPKYFEKRIFSNRQTG